MSVNQVVKWKQILPSSLQMYSFSRGSYTPLVLGICCLFHKFKITYFINMREHVNKCINAWLTCKNKVGHCRCLFSPSQPNLFFTALQWHCPSYKQLQKSGIMYEENFLCSTVRRSQSCSLKLIRTTEELYPGETQSNCSDLTTKLSRGKCKIPDLRNSQSIQEEHAATNSCKLKTTATAEQSGGHSRPN